MLLLRDRRPPARPAKGERNSSPAPINDDGREKFQCRVAAASDIVVARNVVVLSSAGGNGKDGLWGFDGNNVINGDAGDDYVEGPLGNDLISGGAGNDTLCGQAGADVIGGGAGSITCTAAEELIPSSYKRGDS